MGLIYFRQQKSILQRCIYQIQTIVQILYTFDTKAEVIFTDVFVLPLSGGIR